MGSIFQMTSTMSVKNAMFILGTHLHTRCFVRSPLSSIRLVKFLSTGCGFSVTERFNAF